MPQNGKHQQSPRHQARISSLTCLFKSCTKKNNSINSAPLNGPRRVVYQTCLGSHLQVKTPELQLVSSTDWKRFNSPFCNQKLKNVLFGLANQKCPLHTMSHPDIKWTSLMSNSNRVIRFFLFFFTPPVAKCVQLKKLQIRSTEYLNR